MARYPFSTFSSLVFGGSVINFLNANWDFETTVLPWTLTVGSTIAQSNVYAFAGTFSMKIVSTTTQGATGASSEATIPVVAGQTYTASGRFSGGGATTVTPQVQLVISWFTAGGSGISQSTGANVAMGTNTSPAVPFITAVAPATAAKAQISIVGSTGLPSGTMYADYVALTNGSSIPGALNVLPQSTFIDVPPHVLYEVDTIGVSNSSVANASVCNFYVGAVAIPANYVASTRNNNDQILLTSPARVTMGNKLFAVWTGGDVGATGVFTIYGSRINGYRGNPYQ